MTMLIAALLFASDPAAAVQQQPAPAVAPKVAEQKICRVETNDSSSRLRKRVCKTQTEWDRESTGVSVNDLKNIGAR